MTDTSIQLDSYTLTVKSHKHTYKVRFEDDFSHALREHLQEGDILIVDANVLKLYEATLAPILETAKHFVIKPREEYKSFEGLIPLIENLISVGFRKNNRLIALGGGITQDMTAFTASIMFRGVDWIFYPTTLIAQTDSCIGSKTALNFGKYKNQLGGFHPPIEVVIDLHFLETLSSLDFRSGMGEMIHYYLVSGEEDFKRISKEYDAAFEDKEVLRGLIHHSLDFKRDYVERDEYDQGPRLVLNYGHSFGHAIESVTNYEVPHGIAVSFGMDIANSISVKRGYITQELRARVQDLLKKNWGDVRLGPVNIDDVVAALRMDKKAVGSEIQVILTKGLGKMFRTPLEVNDEVKAWISECFESYI